MEKNISRKDSKSTKLRKLSEFGGLGVFAWGILAHMVSEKSAESAPSADESALAALRGMVAGSIAQGWASGRY